MSEKEFWEDDPQLYWAYHIFYLKKQEIETEKIKYSSWLQGKLNYIAHISALGDGFSKGEKKGYPEYEELFGKQKVRTEQEKDSIIIEENNFWARF